MGGVGRVSLLILPTKNTVTETLRVRLEIKPVTNIAFCKACMGMKLGLSLPENTLQTVFRKKVLRRISDLGNRK
jgi:hypothetical protein